MDATERTQVWQKFPTASQEIQGLSQDSHRLWPFSSTFKALKSSL